MTFRQEEAQRLISEKNKLVADIMTLIGQFEASNGATADKDAEAYISEQIDDIFFDDIKAAKELIEHDAPCHKDFQSFHDAREG